MVHEKIEMVPVIRVLTEIGAGTREDPRRKGFQYWDINGKFLFETEAEEIMKIAYE